MHFLLNCLKPDAVMMLFVALFALVGGAYPGYRNRNTPNGDGIVWLLWLLLGILAVVAWVILTIAS